VRDYQTFRNGYQKEIQSENRDRQIAHIRSEFIRNTHVYRSAKYAKNLGTKLKTTLNANWGIAFAKDLGGICQAHGESFDELSHLSSLVTYENGKTANLQFIASLLRIADIMHFGGDRAPSILSDEIDFKNPDSFKHWAIKQEGVSTAVQRKEESSEVQISFSSFFRKPDYYYEMEQYIRWVECELDYFSKLEKQWNRERPESVSNRWRICFHENVNRTGIRYDDSIFTPVDNMSFTLDQRRIIELLMGVGLYKDKYACIRELYQNSLDACRCMQAISGTPLKCNIEFGLEFINESLYLYCLDTGIGMTKEVIEEYLLHIGNSFYKSRDFDRKLSAWDNPFTPVSQFGIGILSCFMLGNQLDVTTIPAPGLYNDVTPLRFSVNGPHEQFYYMPPDESDIERIGQNGTLLRICLTDPSVITNNRLEDMWLAYFSERLPGAYNTINKSLFGKLNHNIHKVISDFVGLPPNNIDVSVRFDDSSTEKIVRRDQLFIWSKFGIDDSSIQEICKFQYDFNRSKFDIKPINENWFSNYQGQTEFGGMIYTWNIALPASSFPESSNLKDHQPVPSFGSKGLFIDGISVKHGSLHDDTHLSNLVREGYLNFIGEVRPQLSVDRLQVTEMPASIKESTNQLLKQALKESVKTVIKHINDQKFKATDNRICMIWEFLFSIFWEWKSWLLDELIANQYSKKISLKELVEIGNNVPKTLAAYLNKENISLLDVNYSQLSEIGKLLFTGKCLSAKSIVLKEKELLIQSTGFSSYASNNLTSRLRHHQIVIYADHWDGCFEDYDIVSQFWPIIPTKLFDCIKRGNNETINCIDTESRALEIYFFSNSICAIPELDPVMIHPDFGLYGQDDPKHILNREKHNDVGCFEKAKNNFWLNELNEPNFVNENLPCYALLVYLAPRALSSEEEMSLNNYSKDIPAYVKGVREGWSLLFLGKKHGKPIIKPGIISRAEMVNAIDNSTWSEIMGQDYRFVDDTMLKSLRSTEAD
jgi:molecular chaperone HtpG